MSFTQETLKDRLSRADAMNPAIKAEWLADLRSGRFQQGRTYLCAPKLGHDGPEEFYCCLGVLYETLIRLGKWKGEKAPGRGYRREGESEDYYGTFPAHETLREVGLSPSAAEALAEHNDQGLSFQAIAQAIEERL